MGLLFLLFGLFDMNSLAKESQSVGRRDMEKDKLDGSFQLTNFCFCFAFIAVDDNFDSVSQVGSTVGLDILSFPMLVCLQSFFFFGGSSSAREKIRTAREALMSANTRNCCDPCSCIIKPQN